MGSRCDVVVIGAGLGGLSAAVMLARKGYSVVLLERHSVPGGYASSFVRGRFEFEVALHELSDLGTPERPGALGRYLAWLGVAPRDGFVHTDILYRSVFPGLDLTLPAGREAYTGTLTAAFPREADGIRRFMSRVFAVAREVDDLAGLQRKRGPRLLASLASLPFSLRAIPRYLLASWGEVLGRDVADPAARAVLSQYWGYLGMGPGSISFFYLALALASYVSLGASHIRGDSQALSNAFVDRLRELGGEARFGCGAARIVTRKGRVAGVVTDRGEEIAARAVVSNADPIATCRELLGPGETVDRYLRRLSGFRPAASTFNVYLGIDAPASDFGVGCHEVFVNRSFDQDAHYRRMHTLETPDVAVASCYNTILPDVSPPGTSMWAICSLMYGRPWERVEPAAYADTKNRIAAGLLDLVETAIPGLRQRAEAVEVSTPLTNMRYTGAAGGSIYGFANPPWGHTVLRPGAGGPVHGLWFAGAWVQPGGGYSPCMISGQIAGQRVALALGRPGRGRG